MSNNKNKQSGYFSARKILSRCVKDQLGSRIRCSRSKKFFKGTRKYFEHILVNYVKDSVDTEKLKKDTAKDSLDECEEESDLVIDEELEEPAAAVKKPEPRPLPGLIPIAQVTQAKFPLVPDLTLEEKRKALGTLYPKQIVKTMNPKKKYVCAVCKSVCDLYGLFVHMKQVKLHSLAFYLHSGARSPVIFFMMMIYLFRFTRVFCASTV